MFFSLLGAYINPNPTNQPIMNPPQSNNPIQNPPVQGTPPMQMGMQSISLFFFFSDMMNKYDK